MLKGWLTHIDNAIPHNSGEFNGVSRHQEANACIIWLTAQTWPRVTSSSFGISKETYLIIIVTAERNILNAITVIFTGIDEEVLFNVFKSCVSRLQWATKHEGKYSTK
jgi:hypothetical protein